MALRVRATTMLTVFVHYPRCRVLYILKSHAIPSITNARAHLLLHPHQIKHHTRAYTRKTLQTTTHAARTQPLCILLAHSANNTRRRVSDHSSAGARGGNRNFPIVCVRDVPGCCCCCCCWLLFPNQLVVLSARCLSIGRRRVYCCARKNTHARRFESNRNELL